MVKLMTYKEMNEKLAEGLDPLDITVEHWNKVVKYLEMASGKVINEEHLKILRHGTDGDVCALCEAYKGYKNRCKTCPYLLFHGETCEGLYPYDGNKETKDDVETSIDFSAPLPPWSRFRHVLYIITELCQKRPAITVISSPWLLTSAKAMRDKLVEIQKG